MLHFLGRFDRLCSGFLFLIVNHSMLFNVDGLSAFRSVSFCLTDYSAMCSAHCHWIIFQVIQTTV